MRDKTRFDTGWKFFCGDIEPQQPTDGWGGAKARAYSKGAASETFDDSEWRNVDLPHDFVSEGNYCFDDGKKSDMVDIPEMESIDSRLFAGGCLPGSVAWYRKRFQIDKDCKNKRIYIHFDGVYRNSTVYVNQYFVGTHTSGYAGFYYDITDFVNIGGENLIAVRVDATEREGWWYEGGGIYRHTWLEIADSIHIEPNGLFACATADLQNKSAVVEMSYGILNRYFEEKHVRIEAEIKDDSGQVIAKAERTVAIGEWDRGQYSETMSIEHAQLWDLENPYLYNASVRLYLDGCVCDEYSVLFGVRDIRFDADSGFYLNGSHIKIKGLCCHHDHAGVGIGVPDSVNEYRIERMKSMGANAVRISHYPATPELLDICDRVGMLVFSETRRMSSAPEDIECLRAMVKRDRNHPSIFLWGIGNEEIFSQHRPETARTTLTMKAEIKQLDSSRPVTSAVVCWDGEQRFDNAKNYVDVTKNLDIMGFNYCMQAWDDYHERMPHQPVIITEDASNSGTRGCYSTDESKGQYCVLDDENERKCESNKKAVKKDVGEKSWKAVAERDYLAGVFVWTGFDYRGEPTPLKYPAVYSQFGVFDYCGFPKDNFYYYKSWWKGGDVLHIFPHWNPQGKDGKTNVYCYSNFDEVEIFVNGKSYGRKTMEKNWYLTWDNVTYEPGCLVAKGYRNGVEAIEKTVKTTGKPYQISMEPYRNRIGAEDTAIITISILDENGLIVPDADNELHFEIDGGMLLGTGNGNPGDHASENIPIRRAFNGKCQLLVKENKHSHIKIAARSEGLVSADCSIFVKDR